MSDETNNPKVDDLEEKLARALESISKLEENNKKLMGERVKAFQDAEEAKEAALKLAEEQAANSTNIDDVKATIEARYKRDTERLTKERDEAFATRDTLLIDTQLKSDLAAANVRADDFDLVFHWLRKDAKVEHGEATINGLAINDAVKSYLTDTKGRYVNAPANSGGGATGGSTTTASKWDKPPETGAEIAEFFKQPVEVTNALAEQWNRPDYRRT